MFFYSAAPVSWTTQSTFNFAPLADLFIPAPIWLLWEEFNHTAVICYMSSFIQLSELERRGEKKIPKVRNGSKWDSNCYLSIESPTFYCWAYKNFRAPRRISRVIIYGLRWRRNVITVFADFTLSGTAFQRVSVANDKYQDPISVLNLGINRWEFYNNSCLVFFANKQWMYDNKLPKISGYQDFIRMTLYIS